jgi:ABC-type transport system substrate-binding protein
MKLNKKYAIALLIVVAVIALALWMRSSGVEAPPAGDTAATTETPAEPETPAAASIAANVAPGYENILRLALNTDEEPNTNDPQKTTEYYAINFQVFDRLAEVVTAGQGRSEMIPGLAESWEISEDGLVYTLHLQRGVKFHDGTEFTADDVKYTFERMLLPDTGAENQDLIDPVKGAAAMMDGTAKELEGLEVVDDYTVKITLNEPYGPFMASLAAPGAAILNREATEAAGADFGLIPEKTIGTGSFIFDKWVLGDELTVRRNGDYWRGPAELDGISWKVVADADTMRMMFEAGEIDLFNTDMAKSQIPYFASNSKYAENMISGLRMGTYYYSFNQNIEPFGDARVRKAVTMAIDRKAMLDALFDGRGVLINGILPPGLIGFNPDLPEITYDPEGAKALLAEAGYPDGFEMTVAQLADDPDALARNELFQAMAGEIGVKVTINQMDEAAFLAMRAESTLPTYSNPWSADFNDPDNFVYTFFSPVNTVRRSFNLKNSDLSQRIVAARAIVDADARMNEYHEIERALILDEAAWIPLFAAQHIFIVNDRVEGFKVSWNGWSDAWYYNDHIRIKH